MFTHFLTEDHLYDNVSLVSEWDGGWMVTTMDSQRISKAEVPCFSKSGRTSPISATKWIPGADRCEGLNCFLDRWWVLITSPCSSVAMSTCCHLRIHFFAPEVQIPKTSHSTPLQVFQMSELKLERLPWSYGLSMLGTCMCGPPTATACWFWARGVTTSSDKKSIWSHCTSAIFQVKSFHCNYNYLTEQMCLNKFNEWLSRIRAVFHISVMLTSPSVRSQ